MKNKIIENYDKCKKITLVCNKGFEYNMVGYHICGNEVVYHVKNHKLIKTLLKEKDIKEYY